MTILDKISKKINKRYKNLTNGRYTKLTNCEILEDLYRIKPYDLVKKTFVIQKRDKIQNTNFLWVQVQMCVRNRDCIKTIDGSGSDSIFSDRSAAVCADHSDWPGPGDAGTSYHSMGSSETHAQCVGCAGEYDHSGVGIHSWNFCASGIFSGRRE